MLLENFRAIVRLSRRQIEAIFVITVSEFRTICAVGQHGGVVGVHTFGANCVGLVQQEMGIKWKKPRRSGRQS